MERYTIYPKDVYKGALILVNQEHPLKEFAEKTWKARAITEQYKNVLMEAKAAEILRYILNELEAEGQIVPVSGLRSREEQVQIYTDSMKENGRVFTEKYVALPDHSEHQTGLAIALALCEKKIDFIRPHFPYDGICKAFREKALRYGFIERYPSEKEAITKIAWEPWHFRYVGGPHAVYMNEQGICLEEYIERLRRYPYGENCLKLQVDEKTVEISYLKMEGEAKEIMLPKQKFCQISGNNVDGVILTLWEKRDGKA